MALVLAFVILLAYPVFCALLQKFPERRTWAFVAIGALPLLSNLPLGFLYGWPDWSGTVRGFGVSFLTSLALALITVRAPTRGTLPFWGLFAFYGLMLFASVFGSTMWLATTFVWWQFASMMIVFAAVGGEAHIPSVRSSVLTGFSIGLVYQASFSIFQKLTGTVQAAGTFDHQNILGLAIEFSLLPLIAAALSGDRRKIVIVGIVSALICIAGSGSRATMGITAAGAVLLGLLSLARRATPRKIAAAFAGAALLAIVTPFAISTLNDRFRGSTFVTEEEERGRFEEAAKAISKDYPLGVGANQFVFVSNSQGYADKAGIGWQAANRSVPVHNAYLLARAETGWLGQFAFTLLLAVPCLTAFRLAFRERKSGAGDLLLGTAISLMANMVHNMYEFAVHEFSIQALLIINIGIVAAEARHRKQMIRNARKTRSLPTSRTTSAKLSTDGRQGVLSASGSPE